MYSIIIQIIVVCCMCLHCQALFANFSVAWPNKAVYFNIAPELTPLMKRSIIYALNYINKASCVQWKQRLPLDKQVTAYVSFQYFYGEPAEGKLCQSTVGYKGTQQEVNLGARCMSSDETDDERNRLVLHEMMHCMGFSHEHQRPNRDCYVKINIRSKQDEKSVEVLDGYFSDWPYDYESIMHSVNNVLIKPWTADSRLIHRPRGSIQSVIERKIGRRNGTLSEYDVEKLDYLYCGGPSYCKRPFGREKCDAIKTKEEMNTHCKQRVPVSE